jgi:ABC-type antimicrobial peptide transport system permease subunit
MNTKAIFQLNKNKKKVMLTRPGHIIRPLVYPKVRVFPILKFVFTSGLMILMTVRYSCYYSIHIKSGMNIIGWTSINWYKTFKEFIADVNWNFDKKAKGSQSLKFTYIAKSPPPIFDCQIAYAVCVFVSLPSALTMTLRSTKFFETLKTKWFQTYLDIRIRIWIYKPVILLSISIPSHL